MKNTYWIIPPEEGESGTIYSTLNGVTYNINATIRTTNGDVIKVTNFIYPAKTRTNFGTTYYDISSTSNYIYPDMGNMNMLEYEPISQDWYLGTDDFRGYSNGRHYPNYIHITGGTDCTNKTLIHDLLTYATQCDSSWNPL